MFVCVYFSFLEESLKQSNLQLCFAFTVSLALLLIRKMQILDALAEFRQFYSFKFYISIL